MSEDAITEGREAWNRVKARERATLADWIAIGRSCAIGRAAAMKAARVNAPRGSGYSMQLKDWLAARGLAGLSASERHWALDITDNASALTAWWDGLNEAVRRRWSHPGAILLHWRKSTAPPKMRQAAHGGRPGKVRRTISWPQDAIRRAAHAMAERRSMDFMILAKTALEAAIRNTDDLTELTFIGERPPVTTAKSLELV